MKKFLQLALTAATSLLLLLFVFIIDDDLRYRYRTGDEARSEGRKVMHTGAVVMTKEDNESFADRRRHLDSVCDKYLDVYRPEYYNLFREEVHLTNLSISYFIAAEKQYSGREKRGRENIN